VLSYWPYRLLTDPDADDLLRALGRVVERGYHLAFMAHINHKAELAPEPSQEAIARVRGVGCEIRAQAPVIRGINDSSEVWVELLREQVRLGIVPYYMFIARDTGARAYFEVSLARALEIYRGTIQRVSGLARTLRGPSMSTTPGKIELLDIREVAGEKVFALRFLQARDPSLVGKLFFARFDPEASWLDHLRPAHGGESFFFE
jgi:L-lysine 2,3-aminomutase